MERQGSDCGRRQQGPGTRVLGGAGGGGRAGGDVCAHGVRPGTGGGRIINILASTVYTPIPNLALSAATRMGVIGFMKNLSDEIGHENILINNVCPGSIMSDRMMENVEDRARAQGISIEDALEQRAEQTALKRIGEPRELAYLVAFLASSRSSYITGTTMLVDGGLVRSVM
ncbi:MAG: SDR family oxidoreductase [Dehalococcoidia bacterium]|nr:SDR family oxidoreductase [Dehalococcoidia bacterium]